MATPAEKTDHAADPFAWDPNPTVLVSRRPRRFYFPKLLLDRDPTPAELESWASDKSLPSVRQDMWMLAQAGVTFLGVYSSSWADLATREGHATTAPDPLKSILVQPVSQAQQAIAMPSAGNKDPATGRLRPDRVQAIFARVLAYLRDHRHPTAPDLWTSADGFEDPEMMLLPLDELFTQRTERGQQAHAMTTKAIPHLRRVIHETVTPVGALHDYAIRHRSGGARAILAACRERAAKWKLNV